MTMNKLSPKERMKIARVPMPERDAHERATNFEEVNLGLASEQATTESQRCLACATGNCSHGCPVEIGRAHV